MIFSVHALKREETHAHTHAHTQTNTHTHTHTTHTHALVRLSSDSKVSIYVLNVASVCILVSIFVMPSLM